MLTVDEQLDLTWFPLTFMIRKRDLFLPLYVWLVPGY